MQPPRTLRPIRLLDMMALVAAVAFTLISPAIMRAIIPAESRPNWNRVEYLTGLTSLVFFWWTATIAYLMVAGSRRDLRRACRGSGYAAIVAVASAFLVLGAQQIPPALLHGGVYGWPPVRYYCLIEMLHFTPQACGVSVASVWLILAFTKGGRRPSNWLDRLGFIVGVVWLLWSVIAYLLPYLEIQWLRSSGIPW